MRDELLLFYERELDYLRKSAAQFAEKHPKVASRLILEPTKCEDPHVERLLEGFAFLLQAHQRRSLHLSHLLRHHSVADHRERGGIEPAQPSQAAGEDQ